MKSEKILFLIVSLFAVNLSFAQIDSDYSVADWYGFKKAAVSYTFDDLTSNQLPVAMPIFDNYGYKMTFFTVINWSGNSWNSLKNAYQNGHEIGSHTVTHPSLSGLQYSAQEDELGSSKTRIESEISGKCLTVAYPNCNVPNESLVSKYYIAGRICSNQIEPKSPANFNKISSIICGSESTNTSAQNLNTNVQNAANKNGWCVFLFHAIDGDGGYSSFSSSQLNSHLQYISQNNSTYWVGTFAQVAKYIKERNDASISETEITADSISFSVTSSLDKSIYDQALTIKRVVPDNWEGARVYVNNKLIEPETVQENGKSYVQFDVVPGTDNCFIANPAAQKGPVFQKELSAGWNLMAYPFKGSKDVETIFQSIADKLELVKSFDGLYAPGNPSELNTLNELKWGRGYYVKVTAGCTLEW